MPIGGVPGSSGLTGLCGGVAGVAVAVAEPDRVARAEHDVIGAGAAHHRLMIVVAHRIGVGEVLEIRRVALLDVVEAHRGRAFAGRRVGEPAGCAAPLEPAPTVTSTQGKRSARQPEAFAVRGGGVAIELLPHLEEAMHRARRIGVVGIFCVGQLKRTGRQMAGVLAVIGDALVGRAASLAGPARQQELVVVVGQTVFDGLGRRRRLFAHAGHAGIPRGRADVGNRRTADQRGWQHDIGRLRRIQLITR